MKFSKITKILLIVLLVSAVILVGVFMFVKIFGKKHILDGPGMINTREGEITGLYFECGGGKDGEYTMFSLKEQADRTVLMKYEYRPPLEDSKEKISKILPEGTLDPFRYICRETECLISAWDSKPGDMILDGATTTIIFYLDSEEFVLSTDCVYPEISNSVFSDVRTQLEQLLEQ